MLRVSAMRSIFSAALLIALSLIAIAAPQAPRGPLSKAELLELVRGGMPSRVIAEVVQQDGIAFKPTEEVLNEFRKAGAKEAVIAAMRNFRHPEPPKPLSDKDILVLLAEDVRSERIVYMVLQRGITFQPRDEDLQRFRASGAKDELIDALRASATKPFSRDQLLQSLTNGQDTGQIGNEIHERGIDFDPTEKDLAKLRAAGASEPLMQAIRDAKRVKPAVEPSPNSSELISSSQTGRFTVQMLKVARVICPPSVSSIPVSASPTDMHTTVAHLQCGDRIAIVEKDSGRTGIDKIVAPGGTEGFVQDSSLSALANSNLSAPVPTYDPEPAYTLQARQDKIQGNVELSIIIDPQGNVTQAQEISKPLGGGLDDKAIETVKTWKFKPATLEGVPVPTRATIVITFRLYQPTS
jgi:TonB family protein